ncbi:MAG: DUF2510 domain-containing protein [Aeromicrobium sp.]
MTDDDIAEGWYTDSDGAIRWWDGAQWTEHVRSSGDDLEATVVLPADRSTTSARRTESRAEPEPDHKRRTWLTATVVGLLAFFLGMGIGGSGNTPEPAVIDDATASSGATIEELDRREADLESREGDLRTKEEDLTQREQDLESRENDLEASPATGTGTIGNGVFEVGAEVQPGTYETEGSDDPELPCTYRVSSDEEGLEIISSEVSEGPGTVTLEAGQYFTSEYCKTWTQTAP